MMKELISIQTAARLSGVLPDTIRAWEKRHQAANPIRDKSGARLYSREDVKRLWLLKALTQSGYKISTIASAGLKKLEKEYELLNPGRGPQNRPPFVLNAPLKQEVDLEGIKSSIAGYRLDMLSHEIQKTSFALPPKDFALAVVAPIMRYIGDLVENQGLDIAQEHAASALIKFHIGRILSNFENTHLKGSKTFALAAPEGELHEFGLLICALAAAGDGHNIYYLGANLPASSLVHAAKALKANHVVVASSENADKKQLGDYLSECLRELPLKTKLCFGGAKAPSKHIKAKGDGLKRLKAFEHLEEFCDYLSR